MDKLLIFESISFVIDLFGALIFAGMAWLYLDAIAIRKQLNVWCAGLGALFISTSFLAGIVFGSEAGFSLRLLGFLILAVGVWTKPMSTRPVTAKKIKYDLGAGILIGKINLSWLACLMPAFVGLGYFRLAFLGMERHLKKMGWGMFFLSISELFLLSQNFQNWLNPVVVENIGKYSLVWQIHEFFLFAGLATVSIWVFSYLLKRFETQILLFLGSITILVFASAVVFYSFLTVKGFQKRYLVQASATWEFTNSRYQEKMSDLLVRAKLLSQSDKARSLIEGQKLEELLKELSLVSQTGGLSKSWILDKEGSAVMVWGSDIGESLASKSVVKRAIKNGESFGFEVDGGVVSMYAVTAIKVDEKVAGFVVFAQAVDSLALRGSALRTGWDTIMYSETKVVSYSGLLTENLDQQRIVGLVDDDQILKEKVLTGGEVVKFSSKKILNIDTLGVWGPIKDANGTVIGMMAVESPLSQIWNEIYLILNQGYKVGIALLLFMLIPALLMANYLKKQLN